MTTTQQRTPTTRFGWCIDGNHDRCRRSYIPDSGVRAGQLRTCSCPCHVVADFNAAHPVGTPVRYWPGDRRGRGRTSDTRSAAWVLGGHTPVVMVDGFAGGIGLTHVEVLG